MAGFDFKTVAMNDKGMLISGAVVFVASFLPYLGISVGPFSESVNAWTSFATLGVLLLLVAAILVALRASGSVQLPPLSFKGGWSLLVLVASGLGTLLVILRGLTAEYVDIEWGGYLLFIAAIVQTAFAGLELKKQL